ncbi:hypothetical protein AQUCO_02300042v1 [Aquilegia coerulea]|uniref:Uncharacterized protein n=1 Tax=Aquilegia coerulea TaxID=218851 RepID=A0A2G5DBT0_AQUCA|nr:hypothetical protein AQUCO_02300042v1 [Aquilegia coerulea]
MAGEIWWSTTSTLGKESLGLWVITKQVSATLGKEAISINLQTLNLRKFDTIDTSFNSSFFESLYSLRKNTPNFIISQLCSYQQSYCLRFSIQK